MRAVLQRVSRARVSAEGEIRGEIGRGLLVLLGVCADDEPRDAEILAAKTANMRIFEDEEGKMNLSCLDLAYEVLVISQFTLCADIKKGNRPSFIEAARPDKAVPLYELYMEKLREKGIGKVEKGLFGAHMEVELLNDGPVTIVCDSRLWKGSGR